MMCMADKTEGLLVYNIATGKYEFYGSRSVCSEKSFCCGSSLEVFLNREWIATRMEHNGLEWYLVGTGLAGKELEKLRVRMNCINGILIPY